MASDKKPSLLMGTILPVLVLTLLAGGGGAAIGMRIIGAERAKAQPVVAAAPPAPTPPPAPATVAIKELAPIVTNLSAPEGSTLRLQTALVYDTSDAAQIDLLSARIGEDVLAYVKTLTVAQIQGASGLQHLREDLTERASLRSDGRVRELVIEMLVVQ